MRGRSTDPAGEHSPTLDRLDSKTGVVDLKAVLQRDGCSKAAEVDIGELCTKASPLGLCMNGSQRLRTDGMWSPPGLAFVHSLYQDKGYAQSTFCSAEGERGSQAVFQKIACARTSARACR